MPKNNQGNRSNRGGNRDSNFSSFSGGGVMDIARERPMTAALGAAAAVGAGVFLWSRRNQISDQISHLSDQIGEWTNNMNFTGSGSGASDFEMADDTAGLTTTETTGSRGSTARKARSGTTSRRGMSETGGGNASFGAHSGGGGMSTAPSGRGRAQTR